MYIDSNAQLGHVVVKNYNTSLNKTRMDSITAKLLAPLKEIQTHQHRKPRNTNSATISLKENTKITREENYTIPIKS